MKFLVLIFLLLSGATQLCLAEPFHLENPAKPESQADKSSRELPSDAKPRNAETLRGLNPKKDQIEVKDIGEALKALDSASEKDDNALAARAADWIISSIGAEAMADIVKSPERLRALRLGETQAKLLKETLDARKGKSAELAEIKTEPKASFFKKKAAERELLRRNEMAQTADVASKFNVRGLKALSTVEEIMKSPDAAAKALKPLLTDAKTAVALKKAVKKDYADTLEKLKELNLEGSPYLNYLTNLKSGLELASADLSTKDAAKASAPDHQSSGGASGSAQNSSGNSHSGSGGSGSGGGGSGRGMGYGEGPIRGPGGPSSRQMRFSSLPENHGQKTTWPKPAPIESTPSDVSNPSLHPNVEAEAFPIADGVDLPVTEGESNDTCYVTDAKPDNGAMGNFKYIFDGLTNGSNPGMHQLANSSDGQSLAMAVRRCYDANDRKPMHLSIASHGSPGQNELLHLNNVGYTLEQISDISLLSVSLLSCSSGKGTAQHEHVQMILAEHLKGHPKVVAYDDLLHISTDRLTVDGCLGADRYLNVSNREQCIQVHKVVAQYKGADNDPLAINENKNNHELFH